MRTFFEFLFFENTKTSAFPSPRSPYIILSLLACPTSSHFDFDATVYQNSCMLINEGAQNLPCQRSERHSQIPSDIVNSPALLGTAFVAASGSAAAEGRSCIRCRIKQRRWAGGIEFRTCQFISFRTTFPFPIYITSLVVLCL